MPLTGLRSFSRAVAISTIWVRKDTDRPSTVAVSRTRRACRRGYRPPAPPGTGSSDHRLVFEVLSGTRAAPEPAVSSRSVCWSCGAGWVRRRTRHSVPPIRAGAGPAGKATKSGVGELLAMRPGGQLLPRPALHSGPRSPVARSVPWGRPVQRALLGRADRDVVEGAAVGVAGRIAKATGMAKACTRVLRWKCEIPGHCAERAMYAR